MKKFFIIFALSVELLNKPCHCNGESDDKNIKIVVVGAGAAGIAAASKLYEYGFNDVKILEAEDRIGGRIYTTPFGKRFLFKKKKIYF